MSIHTTHTHRPKLIGFSGKKRAGKNTAAEHLKFLLMGRGKSSVILGFADALKAEVATALKITVEELEANKEAYRKVLQSWGSMRREIHGKDYWINQLKETILSFNDRDYVFIADVRHLNELEFIRECNGLVFRVTRTWRGVVLDDKDSHVSETELDFEKFDNEFIAEHSWELRTSVAQYLNKTDI